MTDKEKKLLDNLKRYLEECKSWKGYGDKIGCPIISYTYDNANIVYNLIIKQEKIIVYMAEDRAEIGEPKTSAEAIKNFYFRKVEEDE